MEYRDYLPRGATSRTTILTHLVKERNAHESFRDLFDNWDARQHGEEFRRRIHEAGERTHCEDEVGADKRR